MLASVKSRLHTYRFTLRQGLAVEVRPITGADVSYLVDIFQHLSADTLYSRFHQALEHVSAEMVLHESEQIVHSATENGRGWLAFVRLPGAPETPIGGARWAKLDEESAEIAMTVRDDYQGQGLGAHFLRILVREGRKAGLKRLVGYVYANNEPVWRMFRACGLPYTVQSEGAVATVVIELSRAGSTRRAPDLFQV